VEENINIEIYNHLKKEFDASASILNHKIKDRIRKSSIPLDIKTKLINKWSVLQKKKKKKKNKKKKKKWNKYKLKIY